MPGFFRRIFRSRNQSPTLASNGPLPNQTGPCPPVPTPTTLPTSARTSPQNPGPRSVGQTTPSALPSSGSQSNHNHCAASRLGNNQALSSQAHPGRIQTNESIPPHSKQQRQTTLRSLDFRREARRSRNKKAEVVQFYSDYCLEWDALRDWLSKRFKGYQFDDEATAVPVS